MNKHSILPCFTICAIWFTYQLFNKLSPFVGKDPIDWIVRAEKFFEVKKFLHSISCHMHSWAWKVHRCISSTFGANITQIQIGSHFPHIWSKDSEITMVITSLKDWISWNKKNKLRRKLIKKGRVSWCSWKRGPLFLI